MLSKVKYLLLLPLLFVASSVGSQQYNVPFNPRAGSSGTVQTLLAASGSTMGTVAGTYYIALTGSQNTGTTWGTTGARGNRATILPPGTLNNFRATASCDLPTHDIDTDTGTNTIDMTITKNQVDTGLHCQIVGTPGADELCTDSLVLGSPVTVADGDAFEFKIVMVGTNFIACAAAWSVDFTPTTDNTTILAGGYQTPVLRYFSPFTAPNGNTSTYGSSTDNAAGEATVSNIIPIAGTITGLLCKAVVGITLGSNAVTSIFINETLNSSFDCSVPTTDTALHVTRPTAVAVSAGDRISIHHTGGTGTGSIFTTIEFKPTTRGRWWTGMADDTATLGTTKKFGNASNGGFLDINTVAHNGHPFWPASNINIESIYAKLGTALSGAQVIDVSPGEHPKDPGSTDADVLAASAGLTVHFTNVSGTTLNSGSSPFSVGTDKYYEWLFDPLASSPAAGSIKASIEFSRD